MSFLHLVYIGDFELDGGVTLRMGSTPDDPIRRPVVRRPIDLDIIKRLVPDGSLTEGAGVFPDNWSIRLENGYLVCDHYALDLEEIPFLRRLVEESDCRLFERGFEVSVDDLEPGTIAAPITQGHQERLHSAKTD
jgi:hypothetical protein